MRTTAGNIKVKKIIPKKNILKGKRKLTCDVGANAMKIGNIMMAMPTIRVTWDRIFSTGRLSTISAAPSFLSWRN